MTGRSVDTTRTGIDAPAELKSESMALRDALHNALVPFRRRWYVQRTVSHMALGCVCSAIAVVLLVMTGALRPAAAPEPWVVVAAALPPIIAAVVSLLRVPAFSAIAAVVDQRCRLKDRTRSALHFCSEPASQTSWTRLQIQDALSHLNSLSPKEVVPFQLTSRIRWSIGCTCVALVTFLLYPQQAKAQPSSTGTGIVNSTISDLNNSIDDLEAAARETHDEDLLRLAEELRRSVAAVEPTTTDVRTGLAVVSELRQQIVRQQAQSDVAKMDRYFQQLAAAMSAASSLRSISEALSEQDYATAARELESTTDVKTNAAEALAASERLKQVADAMQQAGFDKFSDKVSSFSDHVAKQDGAAAGNDLKEIARTVRKQQVSRQIQQALEDQLSQLAESRHQLQQAGVCPICGGDCPPGKCRQGERPGQSGASGSSIAGDDSGQTEGGSSNGQNAGTAAGSGESGELAISEGTLQMARLTGQLGTEGESQRERTITFDDEAEIRRKADEVYRSYRRMSETVIESESIPYNQRQLIRRYFESIRPAQAEVETDEAAVQSGSRSPRSN
jgi:hypothetical protein